MLKHRQWGAVALSALCMFFAGCSKDTGQTGVTIDAAKVQAEDANRIKEIENNPNIPPAQKQAILARIKNRGAMSQAGQATTGK